MRRLLFLWLLMLAACNPAPPALTLPVELTEVMAGTDSHNNDITIYYPQGWFTQGLASGVLLGNVETTTPEAGQMLVYLDFLPASEGASVESVLLEALQNPSPENPIPPVLGEPQSLRLGEQLGAVITSNTQIALVVEKDAGYVIASSRGVASELDLQRDILYALVQAIAYQYNQ